MSRANEWKRRLQRLAVLEITRAERRTPSGFAARHGNDSAAKPASIRNISATGLYLLTEERWPLGELILLTLQKEGPPEHRSELQIAVQARVVRHGEDGIGLSFVLPTGLDANLWGLLVRNAVILTDPKEVLHLFRLFRTILFLCRLCDAAAEEAIQLFGGELDKSRTEGALEIALRTEKLLASEPHADRMRAHPKLVASILKNGSWANDDLTRQLWVGLLVTSCTVEGTDESNKAFVDLLINITPTQSHIFVAACKRAMELMKESEPTSPARIVFMPEEMVQVTGMYDLYRIAMDIAYLFNFGLVEKNFDFTSYLPAESIDVTPTSLCLELYKRCRGHYAEARSAWAEAEDA
jgi:hypothetical protein